MTLVSNVKLCMTLEPTGDNIVMATCQLDNLNQVFAYDSSEEAVKIGGMCLEHDTLNNDNVYMNTCHGKKNQRWYYSAFSHEIKTLDSEKCLDKAGTNNLKMYICHGGSNQKFEIPSGWKMTQENVSASVFVLPNSFTFPPVQFLVELSLTSLYCF